MKYVLIIVGGLIVLKLLQTRQGGRQPFYNTTPSIPPPPAGYPADYMFKPLAS